MFELHIKLKLFFLRLFISPYKEFFFNKLKGLIKDSVVYQKEYHNLLETTLRNKLPDVINNNVKFDGENNFSTHEPIQFGSVSFGYPLEAFKNLYPKPDLVVFEHFEHHLFTICTFRENLLGIRLKRNFLFCDGEFFMGEIVVPKSQSFSNHGDVERLNNKQIVEGIIHDILSMNHIPKPTKWLDFFTIRDEKKGFIRFVDTGFSFKILYFSTQSEAILTILKRLFYQENNQSPYDNPLIHNFLQGGTKKQFSFQ